MSPTSYQTAPPRTGKTRHHTSPRPLPQGKRGRPRARCKRRRVLAQCRGVEADAIARQTTENFFRLFAKIPRNATVAA